MIETARDRRLPLEAGQSLSGSFPDQLEKELDRDEAPSHGVGATVDGTEATLADLLVDAKAIVEELSEEWIDGQRLGFGSTLDRFRDAITLSFRGVVVHPTDSKLRAHVTRRELRERVRLIATIGGYMHDAGGVEAMPNAAHCVRIFDT
jgi:hypothetical protein